MVWQSEHIHLAALSIGPFQQKRLNILNHMSCESARHRTLPGLGWRVGATGLRWQVSRKLHQIKKQHPKPGLGWQRGEERRQRSPAAASLSSGLRFSCWTNAAKLSHEVNFPWKAQNIPVCSGKASRRWHVFFARIRLSSISRGCEAHYCLTTNDSLRKNDHKLMLFLTFDRSKIYLGFEEKMH